MLKQFNTKVDLTEGSILRKLIIFTIPMFIANIFQQLYSLSDALIIGQFADNDAFAAVNGTGSFVFFLVGFFNGTAMGASVIISKYFGAKDKENVKKSIHTVAAFGIIASILATIIGLIITPFVLSWLNTPASVYDDAFTYLTIYFGGVSTVIIYNICMGIMRATGDSTNPLIYLIISSLINVILDLLFVAVFKMGVAGAAIATVISQGVSCVLCIIRMTKLKDETRLVLRDIRIDKYLLRQTLIIGLPTGLQNSIISIGNLVVQKNINSFGPFAMSGYGAYSKIEGFGFLPITCMSMALTTFVSQNLGAKLYKRAKEAAFIGTLISVVMAELIGLLIMLNASSLLRLFTDEIEAIPFGITQANIVSFFFFLLAFSHCASGILRGCGKSIIPMLTMLAFWCIVRVTYVTITIDYIPQFQVISWAYPLTWTLSSIVFIVILLTTDWVHGLEKIQIAINDYGFEYKLNNKVYSEILWENIEDIEFRYSNKPVIILTHRNSESKSTETTSIPDIRFYMRFCERIIRKCPDNLMKIKIKMIVNKNSIKGKFFKKYRVKKLNVDKNFFEGLSSLNFSTDEINFIRALYHENDITELADLINKYYQIDYSI